MLATPMPPLTTRPDFTRRGLVTHSPQDELWRPVVGYEGWYSVSNLGRIRRDRRGGGSWAGRVLRATVGNHGYPFVALVKEGIERKRTVHRLVAEAFLGPCPPGYEVNHRDSDRENPMIDNLEYVTRSENILHAYRHGSARWNGRQPDPGRGESCSSSKLTEDQVREIRASSESDRRLAARFGVGKSTIGNIRTRQTWRHVV